MESRELYIDEWTAGGKIPRWAFKLAITRIVQRGKAGSIAWNTRVSDGGEMSMTEDGRAVVEATKATVGIDPMPDFDEVLPAEMAACLAEEDELLTFAMVALDAKIERDAEFASKNAIAIRDCKIAARRYHRGSEHVLEPDPHELDVDRVFEFWRCLECGEDITDRLRVIGDLKMREERTKSLNATIDTAKSLHFDISPCAFHTLVRVGRERGKSI